MKEFCRWLGDTESCCYLPVYRKSYCENHYSRVFLKVPTEMADYIINKEIDSENITNRATNEHS